jgi:hypothetical protein
MIASSRPGRVYRHRNGHYYREIGRARCAYETVEGDLPPQQEVWVCYQQLYASSKYPIGYIWTQPERRFEEGSVRRVTLKPYNEEMLGKRFKPVKKVPRAIRRIIAKLDRE